MGKGDEVLAVEFDRHRPHLLRMAYQLTARPADAEDAVQEAWLRLVRLDEPARAELRELGAWLTTVVGRICLDWTRSAAARREHYVGSWLPEPVVGEVGEQARDPLDVVVDHEELRVAALRVLHELSPEQRLAFVLHDGFDVPFTEIADVLGCTVATARQHASRGRRAVAEAELPPRTPLPEQQRVLEEFLAAVSARDVGAVARVLHPRAVVYGDSGGKARTARRPVVGVDKVARFIVGLSEKYGDEMLDGIRPVLVNGDLGLISPGGTGNDKIARRVMAFAVRDGRVAEVFDVVNPDKLGRAPL